MRKLETWGPSAIFGVGAEVGLVFAAAATELLLLNARPSHHQVAFRLEAARPVHRLIHAVALCLPNRFRFPPLAIREDGRTGHGDASVAEALEMRVDELALWLGHAEAAAFEVTADLVAQLCPARDVIFFLLGQRLLKVLRNAFDELEVGSGTVLQGLNFVGLKFGDQQPILADFAPVSRGADGLLLARVLLTHPRLM